MPRKVKILAQKLEKLNPHASSFESYRLSFSIYQKTTQLNRKFKRTTTPKIHNFLVNIGLKEKGLCYDFSDALYSYLKKQNYPHFRFHFVVSNRGEYLFEHNALVISCPQKKILEGLLIDAWRDSHHLYVVEIEKDKGYRWVHRQKRCFNSISNIPLTVN